MSKQLRPDDLDVLMQKVRADVEARKVRVDSQSLTASNVEQVPPPIDANRMRYTAAELLATYDVVFLRSVYLAMLGREPEGDDAARLLQQLRLGQITRIDVIDALKATDEAQERGARIVGLWRERFLNRIRRSALGRKSVSSLRIIRNIPRLASYMRQVVSRIDAAERKVQQFERQLAQNHAEKKLSDAQFMQQIQALTSQFNELQGRFIIDAINSARKSDVSPVRNGHEA